MKRVALLIVVSFLAMILSGCIISKSPTTTDVTTTPGTTTTFSITVFPSTSSYTWTLDGTALGNTASSYQYTPTGGEHTLSVTATSLLGTDTQTWNILDAEVVGSVGTSGGTVVVDDPESPIVGAQADIPAGALDATVTITISQADTPTGLTGQVAGTCISFGPDGTQFSTPVELALPYADKDNDGIVDETGVSELKVRALYYNETTQAWENVQVVDRDTTNNLIYISVTHFSEYTTSVPMLTWTNTFGSTGYEWSRAVQQTSDGGYIVAGQTDSSGSGGIDAWLIKIAADGSVKWDKTYGGTSDDVAYAVRQTTDGGYIITGYTQSFGAGGQDVWLVKTDANGNEDWSTTFGGTGTEWAASVQETSDGGFILTGTATSYGEGEEDVLLLKTDMNGTLQWQTTFGLEEDAFWEVGLSVQQTSDDGYILIAISSQAPAWLIKTDASGNKQWEKLLSDSVGFQATSLQITDDGGYIVAGINSTEVCLMKTDTDGNEQWHKMLAGSDEQESAEVQQTSDGGYILAGGETGNNAWLIKTDADGDEQWRTIYGGPDDRFTAVQETTDSGYILAGFTVSMGAGQADIWLVKTDAEGNVPVDWYHDRDGDGLLNTDEIILGTNPDDADTDDDGIVDGQEDANQNGVIDLWETDPCNADTDSDGLQDGTELGITIEQIGLDTDTAIFLPDLDSTTTTDPLDVDTDQDGQNDGEEDANHNGHVDTGESDPLYGLRPPVAEAGGNQIVVGLTATVTLDGSGSTDPDGNIAAYAWQQTGGPTVSLSDPTAVQTQFTVSVPSDSTLTFELTVTDTTGLTSTDICEVLLIGNCTFNKTYGESIQDRAFSVQQTSDCGYILAGETMSGTSDIDAYLIKTDVLGNKVWDKSFGGAGIYGDAFNAVKQTNDGGYILAGYTSSFGAGNSDVWLIKTDSNGNIVWANTFGGSDWDEALAMQQTSDGGYILAGRTFPSGQDSDALLIKTDANGNIIWDRTFGENGSNDETYAVQQTSDGGYILAGWTSSYGSGNIDAWLIKTNANGHKVWSKTFGSIGQSSARAVQQTSDGSYILAGCADVLGGENYDAWLIKIDSIGNKLWEKAFDGSSYNDVIYAFQQTSDGGYILAGSTSSDGVSSTVWLIKTDSIGNLLWDKTFGGDIWAARQTSDGGYILAGGFYSDQWDALLIKTDANGNAPATP